MPWPDDSINPVDVEPLELPPLLQGAPAQMPKPPQPQKPSWKEYAPLAALLPIVAKSGGRAGVAALLQGMQQARARREGAARQGYQDERQAALDRQQAERYQSEQAQRAALLRQQEEDRRATQERQRESDRRALIKEFTDAVNRVDTPEAVQALLDMYGARASALGMTRSDVQAFAMETATPTVLQQRAARARLEDAKKTLGDDAANFTYQMPGEPEPITFAELQRRAGFERDPQAPAAGSRRGNLTEFEAFFADVYLPAVIEERKAAGKPDLTPAEIRDLTLQARDEWAKAARDTSRGETASERAARARAEEARLDEEADFLLRRVAAGQAPSDAASQWRRIARGYAALGINFEARRDALARTISRDAVADAQRRGALGFEDEAPTADDITAAFDAAMREAESPAPAGNAGRGAAPMTPLTPGVVYAWENGRLVPKR